MNCTRHDDEIADGKSAAISYEVKMVSLIPLGKTVIGVVYLMS
jgi:hypothetical protein